MMKRFVLLLVVSFISVKAYADEDFVQYCQVDFKQSFTLYADYGEQTSSFYSQHKARMSQNKWDFDEEVLFFSSDKKKDQYKDIAVWSSEDEDEHPQIVFSDSSVDKEPGATIRIDYSYKKNWGIFYTGDITYYVYQDGKWSAGVTKEVQTSYTSHKADAVIELESDDDELHNLRCGPRDDPPVIPDFKFEICPYVPNTLQTNYVLPGGNPFGALQMGSNNYIHLAKHEDSFYVSDIVGFNTCVDANGRVRTCTKTNKKPAIDGFPKTPPAFPNTDNKPDKDCKRDNPRDCYLTPGVYKDVKIAENATLVLEGGRYYFSILKFEAEGASLEVRNPTEINYKEILFEKSDIKVNANPSAKSENLLFIGHGTKANFYLEPEVNNAVINAYVFVDKDAEDKDNGFGITGQGNVLNGGVSSHSIAISGVDNHIKATNNLNCYAPDKPEISAIEIVPTNIYLQCVDNNKVYVKVADKDGKPIQDIGNSSVDLYSTTSGAVDFTLLKFDTTNSWFEFAINRKANSNYGPIEVQAKVVGNEAVNDKSHLVYAPVAFNFNSKNEKQLISGKPDKISVQALACGSDGTPIVGNYSKKSINQSQLHNTSFSPGNWADNANKLTFNANFINGEANADIRFNEAGSYVGRLVDTVKCEDFYVSGVEAVDCPKGESKQIVGELKFKARPWTFALCRSDLSPLPAGNINDANSPRFVAAGEKFSLTALPISWQSGGAVTGEVATRDNYCNRNLITKNFAKGQVGNISVNVTFGLSQPSDGVPGTLTGGLNKSHTASEKGGYYLFDSLSWNEVGQLKLMVASSEPGSSDSASSGVQSGYRSVGRFYPHHFAINKSEWKAPDNQGEITYLSQPFREVEAKVTALNADGASLKNYHHFDSTLRATFKPWQDSNSMQDNPLLLNGAAGEWKKDSDSGSGYSYWELTDNESKVLRKGTLAPLTTKENGPFNIGSSGSSKTDYSLQVEGVDPVYFLDDEGNKSDHQAFIHQPKLRYGRMVLSSVGGKSGDTIKVPLRVEYWNGTNFVVNSDDSGSSFSADAGYQCKKTLWQTPTIASDSKLSISSSSGSNTVKGGVANSLFANADPNQSLREQVQFWLRLDDISDATHTSAQVSDSQVICGTAGANSPWLQYNWRGKGDEDPSTVVTFGIYRGNDKIIFRSEEGLTGL